MLSKYVMGAHAVVLCYDITSTESFENLEDWMAVVSSAVEARRAKTGSAELAGPKAFVIGNKTDISHLRTVKMAKHLALATKLGGPGFLCSAKTGDQVGQAFFRIAADLAGVKLAKADVQVQGKTITAHIINHAKDDPSVKEPRLPGEGGPGDKRRCAVM
jgi:Ras-related protein Rab-28